MKKKIGKQWKEENGALVREFEFEDFGSAMEFVNKVAELAELVNHHPDILIHGYKKVRLSLTTHEEGGVGAKDVELAKLVDDLKG